MRTAVLAKRIVSDIYFQPSYALDYGSKQTFYSSLTLCLCLPSSSASVLHIFLHRTSLFRVSTSAYRPAHLFMYIVGTVLLASIFNQGQPFHQYCKYKNYKKKHRGKSTEGFNFLCRTYFLLALALHQKIIISRYQIGCVYLSATCT
jgi:hypothetical protein